MVSAFSPAGMAAGHDTSRWRVRVVVVSDEELVLEAAQARASALARGDGDALVDLLHERFSWTTHLGEQLDRTEYVHRNTAGHTVWRSQELGSPRVVVEGDTAVLHAEVTDVVLSGDHEPTAFRMPMTQVWVRMPDGWQCLAGHAGPRLS
jgi:ketosteroid isomerase-like protein